MALGPTRTHDELTQGAVRRWHSAFLTTSAGTSNLAYDSARTVSYASFQPSATSTFRAVRMIVHIEDGAGADQSEYGAMGASLTTGLYLRVANTASNATIIDLLSGKSIVKNADYGRYCYDVNLLSWGATPTNEAVQARWTFERAGVPLRLEGSKSEGIVLTVQDTFAALVDHTFCIQGYFEEDST